MGDECLVGNLEGTRSLCSWPCRWAHCRWTPRCHDREKCIARRKEGQDGIQLGTNDQEMHADLRAVMDEHGGNITSHFASNLLEIDGVQWHAENSEE